MNIKTALSTAVFVLAAGMVITLLVFWNVYIISDYHTIKELYFITYGDSNVPAKGRWIVLAVGITFLSLVLVALSFFFVTFLRGNRFKQQQKDFVNMISHELKLPMSSIQMFAQTLVEKEVSELERARFLECILNDCTRMNNLVSHLLKAQQIERGALPVDRKKLDLVVFLKEFVGKWARPLKMQMDPSRPYKADLDPVLLELALTNLVNNAEKYGNGSIPEIGLAGDENWIRISVRDAGMPIPKKYAKKIFRRFFRMPTRETRRQNGVGLGLYIVKTVVHQHKGKIELTSGNTEGEGWKGNCFTMILPRSI
jgi:two-component system, OmpR family, phosphate regulon sensor histidine kinase PhoR